MQSPREGTSEVGLKHSRATLTLTVGLVLYILFPFVIHWLRAIIPARMHLPVIAFYRQEKSLKGAL